MSATYDPDRIIVEVRGFRGSLSQAVIRGLISEDMLDALDHADELEPAQVWPTQGPISAIDRLIEERAHIRVRPDGKRTRGVR